MDAERYRMQQNARREKYWRRWGPFLSERQWGTVREDYSWDGEAWDHFPFSQAHIKAYRWGEDGIGGISDNHQRLCFAPAFWNGRDPILKERLFGLAGPQGNHAEDVKEYYYYLDNTPSHAYMKFLYKYPQEAFPYDDLQAVNGCRSRTEPEYELIDTGVFDGGRYFDILVEYAKADDSDILIRITAANRGPERAVLHLLPTLWFRNMWSWDEGAARPALVSDIPGVLRAEHATLGRYGLWLEGKPRLLFTENESNSEKLWGFAGGSGFYKDAFNARVTEGREDAVNPAGSGTKACGWYLWELAPHETRTIRLRLTAGELPSDPGAGFDAIFGKRIAEADEFYASLRPPGLDCDASSVHRQALAGLLWSQQYYHYVVETWLNGDPAEPPPPEPRKYARNHRWMHLYNSDVISMPDKWEYPWYASWDLAFHMIPMAVVDPDSAKAQLGLFLREWYMHPNGQIPAYEWNFNDVNPPVHAWACWRVYQIDAARSGKADHEFLESVFHKLLMNFTWWVNRKDSTGNNIFEGGFLGLDNVGLFDRSKPLPTGGLLEQSDGTGWMAMYCLNMLRIALELASVNRPYEDIASKFFEHFLYISSAMNQLAGFGLWDEADGFYYDRIRLPDGQSIPMRVRSLVGLLPLVAVEILEPETLDRFPAFRKRMEWFIQNRPDLSRNIASMTERGEESRRLLALVPPQRLRRLLRAMLDESEFLSPFGIRSLSRYHADNPFELHCDGFMHRVEYEPAESRTPLFGGNSNWRGPVWFPLNYLLIESLRKYHHYFGDGFQVEFPTGTGKKLTLDQAADALGDRLIRLFLQDGSGRRPVFGGCGRMQDNPSFRDNLLFYEYFDGDTGAGLGASHQTGWTSLVANLIQETRGIRV